MTNHTDQHEHRRHTTAEAVQYWYDAATERREERDRLRAVVARIGQMADCWEQQLPEVIRTPAVVSALRAALEPAAASAVRPPATDRTALRDRIAEALMRWAERNNDPQYAAIRRSAVVRANAYSRADAVLAVLAADGSAGRVADDTQPETLRPATTEWTFEACYDADNDKWHGIGGTYSAHAEAKDAFKRRAENDSGHVKHFRFRLVRATTTYTVEDERTPPPTPPAVGGAQQPQED